MLVIKLGCSPHLRQGGGIRPLACGILLLHRTSVISFRRARCPICFPGLLLKIIGEPV
jgi:hypothetical protein